MVAQKEADFSHLRNLVKGSHVWVKRPGSSWDEAVLCSEAGPVVELVNEEDERFSLEAQSVQPANPELLDGVSDLTKLSYLNEPGILYNLAYRYQEDSIYTRAGPVLIALNPCKPLPLYTQEVANHYRALLKTLAAMDDVNPHIYLVAGQAYRAMVESGMSQSMIVSGESGAGKTETTKIAMRYFAQLSGGHGIEDQVLETNPLLEAFGNAKTLRNHNSSRFGKLIQIHFGASRTICGAQIHTYLLEKSRVVYRIQGERSFHIFYQLVRGASAEERRTLHLPDDPSGFAYLAQSQCYTIAGTDDAAGFVAVKHALAAVGIAPDTQAMVFKLLSAILWLGNVELEADGADAARVVSRSALETAAELLEVAPEALEFAMLKKKVKAAGEVVVKSLNVGRATDTRDALAKALYASLFNWLVDQVNGTLAESRRLSGLFIAILDIYGFESFDTNSFEQLCINYANECLQQQFNRHLFKLEQQEYEREGIDWTHISFQDNQARLDLLDAKPPSGMGILSILDDQCNFPGTTDSSLCEKLRQSFKGHEFFGWTPGPHIQVVVQHYAGDVTYDCHGFLEKNKDVTSQDVLEMLCASGDVLVCQLAAAVRDMAARKATTVAVRFRDQLKDLIASLDKTALHFVRCIKPNVELQPDHLDEQQLLHQLKCCGVLEVTRIAAAGYPTRYLHRQFVQRYQLLLPEKDRLAVASAATGASAEAGGGGGPPTARGGRKARLWRGGAPTAGEPEATRGVDGAAVQACKQLVEYFRIPPAAYRIGVTKVFFRAGVLGQLEETWLRMQQASHTIQTWWRMARVRKAFLTMRRACITLQAHRRGVLGRRTAAEMRRRLQAAVLLQTRWRMVSARRAYRRILRCVVLIQMAWRWRATTQRIAEKQRLREEAEAAVRAEEARWSSVQRDFGMEAHEIREALVRYMAWQRLTDDFGLEPDTAHQRLEEDAELLESLAPWMAVSEELELSPQQAMLQLEAFPGLQEEQAAWAGVAEEYGLADAEAARERLAAAAEARAQLQLWTDIAEEYELTPDTARQPLEELSQWRLVGGEYELTPETARRPLEELALWNALAEERELSPDAARQQLEEVEQHREEYREWKDAGFPSLASLALAAGGGAAVGAVAGAVVSDALDDGDSAVKVVTVHAEDDAVPRPSGGLPAGSVVAGGVAGATAAAAGAAAGRGGAGSTGRDDDDDEEEVEEEGGKDGSEAAEAAVAATVNGTADAGSGHSEEANGKEVGDEEGSSLSSPRSPGFYLQESQNGQLRLEIQSLEAELQQERSARSYLQRHLKTTEDWYRKKMDSMQQQLTSMQDAFQKGRPGTPQQGAVRELNGFSPRVPSSSSSRRSTPSAAGHHTAAMRASWDVTGGSERRWRTATGLDQVHSLQDEFLHESEALEQKADAILKASNDVAVARPGSSRHGRGSEDAVAELQELKASYSSWKAQFKEKLRQSQEIVKKGRNSRRGASRPTWGFLGGGGRASRQPSATES